MNERTRGVTERKVSRTRTLTTTVGGLRLRIEHVALQSAAAALEARVPLVSRGTRFDAYKA